MLRKLISFTCLSYSTSLFYMTGNLFYTRQHQSLLDNFWSYKNCKPKSASQFFGSSFTFQNELCQTDFSLYHPQTYWIYCILFKYLSSIWTHSVCDLLSLCYSDISPLHAVLRRMMHVQLSEGWREKENEKQEKCNSQSGQFSNA